MTGAIRTAMLVAVVLLLGFAVNTAIGQDAAREAIQILPEGDVVTTTDMFRRVFERDGVNLSLRRTGEGVTVAEIVSPEGGELTLPGMTLTAARFSMDLVTRAVTAEGGVTVTTTADDGSTVTLRTDRMTIERQ